MTLIPLASPIGLGETNVMELTPETWNEVKNQDVFYREGIDGVIRLFLPVSAIISPAYPVAAKTRMLFCWRCNQITEHKFVAGYWNRYQCDCGFEQEYLVVTRTGKL